MATRRPAKNATSKRAKSSTQRLGRGLSALIPDIQETDAPRRDSLTEIKIDRISPNPFQPRQEFDPEALAELKNSISQNGLITPVTVRPHGEGYQLIAGERRLRAVTDLAFEAIPAYVLPVTTDEEMLEMSLVENIQRENLNPIEEAQGYQRLIDECSLTQEEAAKKVGKDRATVANFLRLLRLPDEIQTSVRHGEVTAGHARALLSCDDAGKRRALWQRVRKEGLSVRQAEKLAKTSNGAAPARKKKVAAAAPAEVRDAEDKLRQIFGTQVRIQPRGKGGQIELEYYSDNDLERILEMMLKLW